MPRKGDTTDEEGNRVTRSLRRRLNSTDMDDSVSGTPKASVGKMGSISELDAISVDDDGGSSYTPTGGAAVGIRRTRARINSSLTVENVTALATGSPARRSTRRNSGAVDVPAASQTVTAAGTPGRRTTRRSSLTSDDGSIQSSQQTATRTTARRSVAARKVIETLDEDDEPIEASPKPRATTATPKLGVVMKAEKATAKPAPMTEVVVDISSDEEVHPVSLTKVEPRNVRVSMKRLDTSQLSDTPTPAKIPATPKSDQSPSLFSDNDAAAAKTPAPKRPDGRIENLNETTASNHPGNNDVSHSELDLSVMPPSPAVASVRDRADTSSKPASPVASSPSSLSIRSSPRLAAASPSRLATDSPSRSSPVVVANGTPRLAAVASPSRSSPIVVAHGTPRLAAAASPSRSSPVVANGTPKRATPQAVKDEPNCSLDSVEPMDVDESMSQQPTADAVDAVAVEAVVVDAVADAADAVDKPSPANNSKLSDGGDDDALLQSANNSLTESEPLLKSDNANNSKLSDGGDDDALLQSANNSLTESEPLLKSDNNSPTESEQLMQSASNSLTESENAVKETLVVPANGAVGDLRRSSMVVANNKSLGTNKSVTFAAEAPATPADTSAGQTNVSADDDVFHDTCADLSGADADAEQLAADADDAELKRGKSPLLLDAGATPMRKRPNLSLMRSSTPIAPAVVATTDTTGVDAASKSMAKVLAKSLVADSITAANSVPLSRSWSQAVHGTTGDSIDRSLKVPAAVAGSSVEELVIKAPVHKPKLADYDDDDEEDSDEGASKRNSFIDGECEEAPEGEEDSLDSEERQYLEDNEISIEGISIGSKDTDEDDASGDNEEDMDSFIVSDVEENVDDDELLDGTGDDLSDASPGTKRSKKSEQTNRKKNRIVDSSSSSEAVDELGEELLKNESLRVEEDDEPADDGSQKSNTSALGEELRLDENDDETEANESSKNTSTSAKDETSSASDVSIDAVSERQVNQLLSKSVYVASDPKAGKGKHNKSVNSLAAPAGDERISFSPYVSRKQQRKSLNQSSAKKADAEPVVSPSKQQRKSLNKSAAIVIEAEPQSDDDVEMQESKPVASPAKFKEPNHAAILSRCDLILNKVNEARRLDKLLNKKEVPVELVEQKKTKKEAALVERARKAAAVLEQQKQLMEKRQRKADKKLRKKAAEVTGNSAEVDADEQMDTVTAALPKSKKAAVPVQTKEPDHAAILSRCNQMLGKASEARRQDKLLNKKEIPEELIELKKQKKEAALAERARKAAAQIEQEKQESEKRQRKADKKARMKLAAGQDALIPKSAVHEEIVSTASELKTAKTNKLKHNIPAASAPATTALPMTTILGNKIVKKKTEFFPSPDADSIVTIINTKGKKSAKIATEVEVPSIKSKKQQHKEEIVVVASIETPIVVSGKTSKKAKKQQAATSQITPEATPTSHEQPAKKQTKLLKIVSEPELTAVVASAKTSKKKRSQVDAAFELPTEPTTKKFKSAKTEPPTKTKKHLNILNSSSDAENAQAGASAAVAAKDNYKILQIRSMPTPTNNTGNKAKKRKNADIREKVTAPEKPQWTSAGSFVVSKVPHHASDNVLLDRHVASSSCSDFIVTSLSKKRKLNKCGDFVGTAVAPATQAGAAELAQFRERAQFDKRVQRESAKQLMQRKEKQRANARV